MSHYKKLGRDSSDRKALFRTVCTALFAQERIETTQGKAKEIQPIAEKLITVAKQGDLAARRQALAFIYDEDVVTKLFTVIGPRYKERQGGYTRLIKINPRRGDNAPMVIMELV